MTTQWETQGCATTWIGDGPETTTPAFGATGKKIR